MKSSKDIMITVHFKKYLLKQGYYRKDNHWVDESGNPVDLEKALVEMSNSTKKPRTPTELMDELSIYCYKKRQEGVSLLDISRKVKKNHATIIYHIQRYKDLHAIDRHFRKTAKEFNEIEFINKYNNEKVQI